MVWYSTMSLMLSYHKGYIRKETEIFSSLPHHHNTPPPPTNPRQGAEKELASHWLVERRWVMIGQYRQREKERERQTYRQTDIEVLLSPAPFPRHPECAAPWWEKMELVH